jgi:hypothetical protein
MVGWRWILALLVFGLSAGCLRTTPREPVTADGAALLAETATLRAETAAYRAENGRLRDQLEGAPRWQGTSALGRIGRQHGTIPYLRLCPVGEVVVGFRGTHGALVDSLAMLCGRYAPNASGEPVVTTELPRVGGSQGGNFERLCGGGSWVVGARGGAAEAVDAIDLLCSRRGDGSANEAVTPLERIGGFGGQPYERLCPPGQVVVGIRGWQGPQVESLSFHCAMPTAGPGEGDGAPGPVDEGSEERGGEE